MATLRITSGPARGLSIECDRALIVGRADADLVVDDAEISRRHVAVRPVGDGIEVEDLGSLNGTFVDGERISAPTRLTPGETLKIGTTSFAIEADEPRAAAPSSSAREATAVRGVTPEPPPPAGPPPGGPPFGGPPGGAPPPPIRLLMKSERGRRLLALLMRLPPPARILALLLVPLLIIGLIVLVAALL
jgi:Inner membrane component of T3SS, cytoplasmic domain